jgi:hypothetical protein
MNGARAMVSDGLSRSDTLTTAKPEVQGSNIEERALGGNYFRPIILLFSLNVVSALLFMSLVNCPVYDDKYNISDVHAYASKGFSVATLLAHTNPPGPTSFLWMAAGVRLLRGEELLDGRIAVLLSWVLLVAGVLIFARYSDFSPMWYGAVLALLVFPHTVEATATLLTEGPSLLFAVLGVLAWTEFASRPSVTPVSLTLGLAGGLSMGIAVTCRQYNLALLPAAMLFALYEFRQHRRGSSGRTLWLIGAIVSLVLAVAPVFFLALVWKGLSSPGMATRTSYSNWEAGVGLNFSRPIIAAFYIMAYLVPLTFPVMLGIKQAQRWRILLAALLGGAVAAYYSSSLLTPGPLHTVVKTLSRGSILQNVFLGLIAVVAIYNACALGLLMWEKRSMILSSPPVAFALLTIVFFIGEQIGVGGNIPFYDRYLLSAAPFLGLIAFSLLPRLTYPRLLALVTMSLAGHIILWRYAFGTWNF